jgi:predicted Fe-S protein YdhL (DUF1289 family)
MDDDIESPCTNVCIIDQRSGRCRGCYRTLAEISRWMSYSRAEKLALLETIAQRRIAAAGTQTN